MGEYKSRADRDTSFLTEQYLGKLGELTLKGSNKKIFERQLVKNVRQALDFERSDVFLRNGRLYVPGTTVRRWNMFLTILLE